MAGPVLVTGGAGFIGSHLVERLLERGEEVYVVDDLSTGTLKNLEAVRRHPGLHRIVDSIVNFPMMDDLLAKVEQVVHLASPDGVRKILQAPVDALITSVRGIEILLNCCDRHGRRVFVASTSEIYGKAAGPLHEPQDRVLGDTSRPRWAYANAKALDEAFAYAYHRERGLPIVIGRFFNVVGPRKTGRWGTVLPNFVTSALDGSPIRVFGDGSQRRCFCHITDAVDAVIRLVDSPEAVGKAFNIGSEEEITILRLAELVKERAGSSSPVELVPYREAYGDGYEEMDSRLPDLSLIERVVGWQPRRSLVEVIDDTVAYFRGHPEVPAAWRGAGRSP